MVRVHYFLLAMPILSLCGCERGRGPITTPNGIAVEPAIIDFGEVGQGQNAAATFRITNNTDKPLTFSRTTTSCPCLSLEKVNRSLEPGKSLDAELRLDLAHEPQFVGGLLMTVSVYDGEGVQVLEFHAKVTVKSRG